jgi:hypothetical protein
VSYQLGISDVIQALPAGVWFVFIVPLLIAEIAYWQTGNYRHYKWILLSTLVIPLVIVQCSIHGIMGDGWQLKGNRLEFRAWEAHAIDLASARISLVDTNGPWQPVQSIKRYSTSELTSGWFTLRNGEKADVFYHRIPAKMLVLFSSGQIYIIAHPGVEKLYHELIARGVRKQG